MVVAACSAPAAGPPSKRVSSPGVVVASESELRTELADHPVPLPDGVTVRIGDPRFRHGDDVEALATSPDGRFLASTGDDLWVRLWDVERRALAWAGRRSEWSSKALAYSPDGRWVASGDRRRVYVWSARDGTIARDVKVDGIEYVRALAFAPDSRHLAAGGGRFREELQLIDVETGDVVATADVGREVRSVAFSLDGKELLAADRDGPATYDARTLQPLWRTDLSKDLEQAWWEGDVVMTVDRQGRVRRHRRGQEGGEEIETDGRVERAAVLGDGRRLYVGGGAWIEGSGKVQRLHPKEGRLSQVAVLGDGRVAFADAKSHAIVVYDLEAGHGWWPPAKGTEMTWPWLDVLWADDTIVAVDDRHHLARHRADDGERIALLAPDEKPPAGYFGTFRPDGVMLSPDGKTAIFTESNIMRHYDVDSGRKGSDGEHVSRDDHGTKVSGWSWRDQLVTVSARGEVTLWKGAHAEHRTREQRNGKDVFFNTVALSADRVVAGTIDGELFLFDRQLRRIATLELGDERGMVGELAMSPGGETLAVARRGTVSLWAMGSARPVETVQLEGYRHYRPTDLSFSPDGRLLAVSRKRTPGIKRVDEPWVRIFEVPSGKLRCGLEGHASTVTAAAFSPDGKRLVTAGQDATLLVWDLSLIHI